MADFIKKARKLERRGELLRAAEYYVLGGEHERAIELFNQEELFLKAAKLCEKIGKINEAADYYAKIGDFYHAAELLRDSGDSFQAGLMFKRAKRYREASEMMDRSGVISEAARMLELESNYAGAAERYLKANMYQSAALCFEQAVELESRMENTFARPKSEDAQFHKLLRNAAEAWIKVPDLVKAAKLFERLNQWMEAGRLYEKVGEADSALKCYEKAGMMDDSIRLLKILNRQDALAKLSAKKSTEEGDHLTAAKLADQHQDLGSAAEYYEKAGNFAEAATRYEKIGDYMLAAEMYFRSGNYQKAAWMYDLAGNTETAAEIFDKLGIFDKAIPLHIKNKNFIRAAKLQLDLKQNEEALRLLLRVIDDYPSTNTIRDLLAIAYFRLQKIDQGYDYIADILKQPIAHETIEPIYEYACALYEEGQIEKSMEVFQRIVAFDKSFKNGKQYLNWLAAINEEIKAEIGETIVGELPIGLVINNRYELLKLLGKGAVGIVYHAADRELNISVAVKILRPKLSYDPDIIEMIKREVTLARMLAHPNIIKIYDLNRAGNLWFVSMEYLDGEEIKTRIKRLGSLSISHIHNYLSQILSALQHSHSNRVVHSDIKPQNIFVNFKNQITLVDFGIAQAAGRTNADKMVYGTPEYISPEQIHGRPATPISDLYSLGVTLFEMTTGRMAFKGSTIDEVLQKQLEEYPPAPKTCRSETPDWLNNIILRLMQKNPAERYSTVSEVLRDFPQTIA